MTLEQFRFSSDVDSFDLQGYRWPAASPRAIAAIAHGAAEHSLRYARVAEAMNGRGYDVWSLDHRGHGYSPGPEGLGDFGEGGWDALVADLGQLIEHARAVVPAVPVVLFAHSMGSFAAQQFILDRSSEVDALVLSGSGARSAQPEGAPPPPPPNAAFEPARTPYDWLSRDEAEVDRYIADPLCGFESRVARPAQRPIDFTRLGDPGALAGIRPDLPVLLLSGDRDPIGRNLEGVRLLAGWYREAGVARVDEHYYPGGRHEMLNETNRDEVTERLLAWLDDVTAS